VMEINRCYQDHVDAIRSRPACYMPSDTEYSDFDESDDDEEWEEYQQDHLEYTRSLKGLAQTDVRLFTDEEDSDTDEQEVEVSSSQCPADVFKLESDIEDGLLDLPPFTATQLEQMWENAPPCGTAQTSSTKPEVVRLQDVRSTESDSSDLLHFTPNQVARLWSATMEMQREACAAYQLQQEQSKFSEAESTYPAFAQFSPAPLPGTQDESAHFTAPPLTTDPQQLALDPAHAPMLALDQAYEPSTAHAPSAVHEPLVALELAHMPLASVSTVHEPSPTTHVSSRPSFHPGVCANVQSLGSAAVVNNIYVPPPRAPFSAVSRQVSAIYLKRPIVSPGIVLDPHAPSFHPRATQLDSTSETHHSPTASLGVIVEQSSDVNTAPLSTTFTPFVHQSVPYTHPEPDELKPPDIFHTAYDAAAPVPSVVTDTSVAEKDLEVPEHLQELFDETVERSKLSSTSRSSPSK